MKKLLLSAAITAALFGGTAHADITLDGAGKVSVTPADTYEIYLSGASAVQDFIEQVVTSTAVNPADRLCDSVKPIYKFVDAAKNGSDQRAYYCTINPSNVALTGLAGAKANLLIYKRNAGGSAMGVLPVAAESAIEFLAINAANCTVPAAPVAGLSKSSCTYASGAAGTTAGTNQMQVPDFGVSDVDPEQFKLSNTAAGFSAVSSSDLAKLTVLAGPTQVFGIAVTTKLRNALQEAQFPTTSVCNPTNAGYTTFPGTAATKEAATAESAACQPSLGHEQVASIFAGKLPNWNLLKTSATTDLFNGASAANKAALSNVHICTRTDGSGTKAQMGINFLNYPCTASATPFAGDNSGLVGSLLSEAGGTSLGKPIVHNLGATGAVEECLTEMNNGNNAVVAGAFNNTTWATGNGRWAIGILGLESNAALTATTAPAHAEAVDYRFIKIDGVSPTVQNVMAGKYHDWAESTFQYNTNHVFATSEKNVALEIIRVAGNPVIVGELNGFNLHSFGQSGFLSSPSLFTANADGLYTPANPVNTFSHGTSSSSVNNCRNPASYKLKGAFQL